MESACYILDENGNPKRTESALAWQEWFKNNSRTLAATRIGSVLVSTVFLAFDHDLHGLMMGKKHAPILYETMIFGDVDEHQQWRWTTKDKALKGHNEIVEKLKGLLENSKKGVNYSPPGMNN